MSKSAPALLQAIEGYSGEHAGSKQHESTIDLLAKVKAEMERGHATPEPSPGKRSAMQAAQIEMPAERGHSGGEGNTSTNKPGSAHESDPAADEGADSSEERKITGAGPVPSSGQALSNLPGSAMAPGIVDIRRMAAMKGIEAGRSSEGNARSNPPGKAAPNSGRIGDVKAPAKAPADNNAGNAASLETPPQAMSKDAVGSGGDPWARAAQKARKLVKA